MQTIKFQITDGRDNTIRNVSLPINGQLTEESKSMVRNQIGSMFGCDPSYVMLLDERTIKSISINRDGDILEL